MTDFDLSPTEQLISESARAYFDSFADNTHLVGLEASATGYDDRRWSSFVELGWNGLAIPERRGGGGGSVTELGTLMFEFGRAAYPSPFLQTVTAALVADTLATGDQAGALLKGIAAGSRAVLLAPLASAGRHAVADGARFVLHGPPMILEWAHVADVVVGMLPIADSDEWITFALDPGATGLAVQMEQGADNERLGVVTLEGFRVGRDQLLHAGVAHADAERALAIVRLLRAAEMAGGADRVLTMTAEYMKQRQQFGVALGSFQAVQHHLANMMTDVAAARLTTFEGLTLAAMGAPVVQSSAVAAYIAGRAYVQTVFTGAHLHGGIGVTKEYVLHHYFRRAKAMQLRLGTNATQLGQIADTTLRGPQTGLWSNP